jgi:hypothetical protein
MTTWRSAGHLALYEDADPEPWERTAPAPPGSRNGASGLELVGDRGVPTPRRLRTPVPVDGERIADRREDRGEKPQVRRYGAGGQPKIRLRTTPSVRGRARRGPRGGVSEEGS